MRDGLSPDWAARPESGTGRILLARFNCIKQYLTLDKQLIILVYNQTSWSYIPDELALGARLAGPCFNFRGVWGAGPTY